jgi:drug/metabolite transporter (DMT)-like permease
VLLSWHGCTFALVLPSPSQALLYTICKYPNPSWKVQNLMQSTSTSTSTPTPTATASRQNTRQQRLITLLGFLVVVLIWGSFPVAAKIGVEYAPPLLLSGMRFCLAFCILATMTLVRRKRLRIGVKQHLQIFGVSLCMVGLPSSIFFVATPYAPVGILTLMWSTTPIFTAIFNIGGKGEAHGMRLLYSLLLGTLGILIVLLGHIPFLFGSSNDALSFAGSRTTLISELAVLCSSVIYGFGLFLAKRSTPDIAVLTLTTWQLFYSGLFIVLLGLIFEWGTPLHFSWTGLGILLYLAIFCSCITFFLMFWLIRRIGAIRTSYSDFIIPGVTLLLSFLILGESLTLAKLGGLLLLTLSVILVAL